MPPTNDSFQTTRRRPLGFLFGAAFILCAAIAGLVALGTMAPSNFPTGAIVTIPKDSTLSEAADILASQRAIRSQVIFKAAIVALSGRSGVKAGSYLLSDRQSAISLAYRISRGIQGLPSIKVTIPEGLDSRAVAAILFKNIKGFDAPAFIALARKQEG